MLAVLLALIQQSASVQGSVRTTGTQEPVPYATVEIVGADRRASADVRGFFTLAGVPTGEWTIRARSIGYTPAEQRITVTAGTTVRVEMLLTPRPISIGAVLVTSRAEGEPDPVGPPPVRVDAATVRLVPAVAEVDVMRALQTLPSVQSASDYSSALYVRGGSSDQTLIALDGIPLFNPYHLGGIFAAIDPDAVSSLDMWPGAVPARLGDRLSGAVQVWTREGGRDRVSSRGSTGFISTRASVDGPLRGGQGSYLVSLRRTYLDLFTEAAKALGAIDQSLPYHFTDAHFKVVHDVGSLGRLSASAYYNQENLANPDRRSDDEFDWGSRTASIDWRQPFGGSLLLEARTGFSSFRSEIDFFDQPEGPGGPLRQTMRGRSYMRDALAMGSATIYRHKHELRIGAQMDAYRLDYDVQRAEDQFFADLLPQFQRFGKLTTFAGFAEDEWRMTDAVNLRLGARVLKAAGNTVLMPRLGAAWRVRENLTLEAGAGRYAQAMHSFRNDESILASFLAYDVLTPSDTGGLSRSDDVVIGGEWRGRTASLRIDAYAKRLHNLAIAPLPADPLETPLFDIEGLARGSGTARGLEVLVRRALGDRRAILASYALSQATRTLGEDRYSPRFDRRHKLDLIGSFPVSRRVDGSARIVASTGQPYTPILGRFTPFTPRTRSGPGDFEATFPTYVLGEHNAARLPGYWRVDLSARREGARRLFGRDGTLTWVFQVINAFNTKNVLAAEPDAYAFGTDRGVLNYLPQLPIVPTFALEWRF